MPIDRLRSTPSALDLVRWMAIILAPAPFVAWLFEIHSYVFVKSSIFLWLLIGFTVCFHWMLNSRGFTRLCTLFLSGWYVVFIIGAGLSVYEQA